MSSSKRPFRSTDEFHENKLDSFRQMPSRELGVLAALDHCAQYQIPLPLWAASDAPIVLAKGLRTEQLKKRGRSGGTASRLRQDIIHIARHDAVVDVRENQLELAKLVPRLRARANIPTKFLEEKEKLLAWAGCSLERAFECAAMILKDTIAFGSPDAVKRSYFEYRRISKDPSQAMRFHVLNSSVIRLLGIQDDTGPRPVTKFVPLYDLTQ